MRLNIGCGSVVADGWVNADADPYMCYVELGDVRHERSDIVRAKLGHPLLWNDESFDCIVANHVLQYVPYLELVPVLVELRRVLKTGGSLRILTPSVKAGFAAYLRGDAEWFPTPPGRETSIDGRFCTWLTDHSTSRSVFTAAWLGELCRRAGFDEIATADAGYSPFGTDRICELDSRESESFILEVRK